MLRRTRLFAVVLSVAVPLVGVVATAGPAAAHKSVPTGSINCHLSQTFTFDPPLIGSSAAGTAGYAYDKITISPAQLSDCTGSTSPSGEVPQLGAGTKASVLKWKGTKVGSTKYAGSCLQLVAFLWPKLKPKYNWTATGLRLKGSKVLTDSVEQSTALDGTEDGYIFLGTATGSFAGPVTISDYFTVASTDALNACLDNGPPVSSLTTDSSTSAIAVG